MSGKNGNGAEAPDRCWFYLTEDEVYDLYNMGYKLLTPKIEHRINDIAKRLLQPDKFKGDLAIAFVLGAWVNETLNHAPTLQGRRAGLPKARKARILQGERSHRAIVEAALGLYSEDDSLRYNVRKTAGLIEKKKLNALRKRDLTHLGSDAIERHLRAARRAGEFKNS